MNNLYWLIYKNLENEVIDLTYKIHFTDTQLEVYSIKIAELLIRCSMEIESISKDLYLSNGGVIEKDENGKDKEPYFDTDCLNYLESKWLLSKKIVYTSSPNFYFSEEIIKILTPLNKANKRGSSGAKWKQAYQAVKHNRSENFKDANIGNLVSVMAALYLLNIYYKNEEPQYIGADIDRKNFKSTAESSLFSVQIGIINYKVIDGITSSTFDDCVYIKKYTDRADKELQQLSINLNYENLNSLDESLKNDTLNKYTELESRIKTSPLEVVLNKNQYYSKLKKMRYNFL